MTRLHPVILRYDSLASTNSEAANQARRGAEEGLCVVSLEQTAGRGRQNRSWLSPKGAGLYFSIVLRPRMEPAKWPLISLMASLAAYDAIAKTCGLSTDIKWPNDLLVQARKLCGILAETVDTPAGRAVILGIGVNLKTTELPPDLVDVATFIEQETGKEFDAEALLESLLLCLDRRYLELEQPNGLAEVLMLWSARSSYAEGKRVRVMFDNESIIGTTRGLASDGALRVETDANVIKIVHAGDVTALRAIEGSDDR